MERPKCGTQLLGSNNRSRFRSPATASLAPYVNIHIFAGDSSKIH
jgi:hypothetical protein